MAASVGIWLGLAPTPILVALLVFAILVRLRALCHSLRSRPRLPCHPRSQRLGRRAHYILLAILISALVIFRHRENIRRLMDGEEPKIGERKSRSGGLS